MSYYADSSKDTTISQIIKGTVEFKPVDDGKFNFGNSTSAYWIRIRAKEIKKLNGEKFISIYNSTIKKAVLYVPVIEDGEKKIIEMHSGWDFPNNNQDDGFLYPIFSLPTNFDLKGDMYIYLQSPYTQNYVITFMSHNQVDKLKMNILLFIGIFIGILLTMVINNFIIYLELNDKAYLFYVLYIMSMIIYQFTLLGIGKIFFSPQAMSFFQSNTIAIGVIVAIFSLIFVGYLFDINKMMPSYARIHKIFIVFVCLGVLFALTNYKNLANYYAHFFILIGAMFMVLIGIKALKKGQRQAKYFIIGWGAMFFSMFISYIRSIGLFPNNIFTVNILLISAAIESILLSAALGDRVNYLSEEKEQALVMYKSAEQTAISNQIAFLQAQIKPHFLYNVLNIIAALCRIDAEKAREILIDLSNYLHHTFDFKNLNKYVLFDEEMDSIKAYVRIEQARFRNKIKVIYELDDTEDLMLPPLILQPLVENAISHGLRQSSKGDTVVLKVLNRADSYWFEVSDNGRGMTEDELHKVRFEDEKSAGSVGIINIRKRLKILYGTSLNIESEFGQGTKISFIIPKRKEINDESNIG